MIVPIDPLKPILDDLLTFGRVNGPARPWLWPLHDRRRKRPRRRHRTDGRWTGRGERPAADDAVRAVAGKPVTSLAGFYRAIWALGEAGVDVPLTLDREGDVFDVTITSSDRGRFLKSAPLH